MKKAMPELPHDGLGTRYEDGNGACPYGLAD